MNSLMASAGASDTLTYFRLNMGPWSSIDHDEPFVAGVPNPKPAGANYYPADLTKEEFEAVLKLAGK